MPQLDVDLGVIRHALFDHSLAEAGESLVNLRTRSQFTIGTVSLGPGCDLSIRVFNRENARDEDGVISSREGAHIRFAPESAWVLYRLSGEAGGNIALARVRAGAKRRIELSDYRIHAPEDGAVRTLRRDLRSPRSILRVPDVRKLKPGEALSMDVSGTLSAGVEVSWGDILGNRLTSILKNAGIPFPVTVRIRTGASATATVRVTDRFSVIASRTSSGTIRLSLTRKASSDHRFGIEASIGAEARADGGIEAALDAVFEAVTGVAVSTVREIAARIGPGGLPGEDLEVLERVARRLGIAFAAERERAVIAALAKLRQRLQSELEHALRWKARIGFSAEYSRIDDSDAIIDFELLDESALAGDHRDILSGNVASLCRKLLAVDGTRVLGRYLDETTLTRAASSGFSLGIGRRSIEARQSSSLRTTRRTSLDGMHLVSFRSLHAYEEENIPGNDLEWRVEFEAGMHQFRAWPSTRDLDCGLHCVVVLERKSLRREDADRMLDFAAMWGLSGLETGRCHEAIGAAATIRVQFQLEHDDLAAISAPREGDGWAGALGAAMPYMNTFPDRRAWESRAALYGPLWEAWFREPRTSVRTWSERAGLRAKDALRAFEERSLPGSFAWTAVTGHPRLRKGIEDFDAGLARLHGLMTRDEPLEAFEETCGLLGSLWTQRLYVAAAGTYLLSRARDAGIRASRSLQIEYDGHVVTL